jgi:hypothetical protein
MHTYTHIHMDVRGGRSESVREGVRGEEEGWMEQELEE